MLVTLIFILSSLNSKCYLYACLFIFLHQVSKMISKNAQTRRDYSKQHAAAAGLFVHSLSTFSNIIYKIYFSALVRGAIHSAYVIPHLQFHLP